MSVRPKYSQIADQLIQLIVSEKQQLNTRFLQKMSFLRNITLVAQRFALL